MATKRNPKEITYTDDELQDRQGERVERNGNLSWIVDKETGEGSYRAPHEINDRW